MPEGSYFIRNRGKISGPFSVKRLRELRSAGQFGRFHEISADRKQWSSAGTLTEIFPVMTSVPQPGTPSATTAATGAQADAASSDVAMFSNLQVVTEWYYLDTANQKRGPIAETEILGLASGGQIDPETMVWRDGFSDWVRFSDCELGQTLQDNSAAVQGVPTSAIAIAAFLFSLLWLGGIGSLLAVVFGFMALSEIRASGGRLRGRQLALTAMILGFVLLILTPVVVLGTLYYLGSLDPIFKH